MAAIPLNNVMPGAIGTILPYAGTPSAGTDEVQTITFGGTPTGGTFTLTLEGETTAAITWSSTNSTLVSNIDTAMEALVNVGSGGVVVAVGTMTAGIGTITCTFSGGNRAKQPLGGVMTAASSLTGTSPTVTVARTTPGVAASFRSAGKGAFASDTTNGLAYVNSGTALAPTWTKTGTQT